MLNDINLQEGRALTLSQLTAEVSKVIETGFPMPFWIKAEIAKLNYYQSSGHCYPSLVEKEKGTIKAEMRATIWANDFIRINGNFLRVTKEPLKEGIQILFRAYIRFHPVYGLSLQVVDIDPSYTLGEMAREKMETVMRLKTEGVFGRNRQLELPLLPKRVAVISVKSSKGFSDFINILENNPWGYAFTCVLFPALLQGDKAVDSITGQLGRISRLAYHFDAVAIIRGGGGDVGLNCYDHYKLAKEVALFPLPVVTGIGHSTNETVVEMVAAYNKITPTDVAYFLIQQFHNFSGRLNELHQKTEALSLAIIEEGKRRWGDTCRGLIAQVENLMNTEKRTMKDLSGTITDGSVILLTEQKHLLGLAGLKLTYRPGVLIKDTRSELNTTTGRFELHIKQLLKQKNSDIDHLGQKIFLLDPVHVLRRGYSITYLQGKSLTESSSANIGDVVITRLFKGEISSEIKSIKD